MSGAGAPVGQIDGGQIDGSQIDGGRAANAHAAAPKPKPKLLIRIGEALERCRALLFSPPIPLEGAPSAWRAHLLFGLVMLWYPAHQLLTQTSFILGGQMWAEMGTNYYQTAVSSSWLDRLLATDAGYIPLPQRLIGILGTAIGLPTESIPYFYTGSAIVLSALMVATVCLPVFRALIRSDLLRFLLAIAVLLTTDFQTRTYLNFTYLGLFLIGIVTALALVDRSRDVPRWAWCIPLLMMSKPGVLAVFPIMVVAALVSARRFKVIVVTAAVFALLQLASVMANATTVGVLEHSEATAVGKTAHAGTYFLGFLGKFVAGPGVTDHHGLLLGLGAAVLLGVAALCVWVRGPGMALAIVGLSLIAFSMVIDAFTFSVSFGPELRMLDGSSTERRLVAAVIGTFLIVCGVLSAVSERVRRAELPFIPRPVAGRVLSVAVVAVFTLWFVAGGWLSTARIANASIGVPVLDVSQWTERSPELDADRDVVCIPINPLGWIGGQHCEVLNLAEVETPTVGFVSSTELASSDGSGVGDGTGADGFSMDAPASVAGKLVDSVAVVVRPVFGGGDVSAKAIVTTASGETVELSGQAIVPQGGGLLQFGARTESLISEAVSVRFEFDRPVEIGTVGRPGGPAPLVMWMGTAPGAQSAG